MTGIDLEGLVDFAAAGDRDVPPYFAGRRNLLQDIESVATRCWTAWQDGQKKTPGATRVIHGAPGAGKSSILRHLERSWTGPGGGAPTMLRLEAPAMFSNRQVLARKLIEILRPGSGEKLFAEVRKGWQVHASVGGVGGQVGRESKADNPDDPIDAVLFHVPGTGWTGPVVIAVDEFQNTSGDRTSLQGEMLQRLHDQGYDAPIMVVLAGLGDTVATAGRLGLSRLGIDAATSLGPLTEDDSRDLFAGWGKHFGLPDGFWQAQMLELAKAGSHWPAHVRNSLSAFADEVVRIEGDMARIEFDRVQTRSHDLRQSYYYARMSEEMQQSDLLLGAVMLDLRDDMRRGEVMELISRCNDPSGSLRRQFPNGMDTEDYYRHLVHRGVLHQKADFSVICPIPSFRRWIIQHCGPTPMPNAKAEATDSARSDSLDQQPASSPLD